MLINWIRHSLWLKHYIKLVLSHLFLLLLNTVIIFLETHPDVAKGIYATHWQERVSAAKIPFLLVAFVTAMKMEHQLSELHHLYIFKLNCTNVNWFLGYSTLSSLGCCSYDLLFSFFFIHIFSSYWLCSNIRLFSFFLKPNRNLETNRK